MPERISRAEAQTAVDRLAEHGFRLSPLGQGRLLLFLRLGVDTHAAKLPQDDPSYGVFGIRSYIKDAELFWYAVQLGLDDQANWRQSQPSHVEQIPDDPR